jgi:hypothetical protein
MNIKKPATTTRSPSERKNPVMARLKKTMLRGKAIRIYAIFR